MGDIHDGSVAFFVCILKGEIFMKDDKVILKPTGEKPEPFPDELRIETRDFVRPDGSIITVKAPKWRLDAMEAAEKAKLETQDAEVLPAPISELESVDTDVTKSNASTEKPSLEMLTVEIKFHLNQMGYHVIEVGKLLIQAKELVPHGEWANWLQNNFNLTDRSARRFMQIVERFGKTVDVDRFRLFDLSTLKPSTLIELLALPEGDEEKFIAEKSAEGKAVADMTVKNLREEIKQWKEKVAIAESRSNEMFFNNGILQNQIIYYRKESDAHKSRADKLAAELAQQKTVEVPPADYDRLQKEVQELRNRPIDVATEFPADYESTKKENAELKARAESLQRDYAVRVSLQQIFDAIPSVLNSDNLQNVISTFDLDVWEQHLAQLAQLHSLLASFDSKN